MEVSAPASSIAQGAVVSDESERRPHARIVGGGR
jgi:hypothetical protein